MLKNLKIVLSLSMVIIIMIASLVPAFATSVISNDRSVIRDDLFDAMKNSKANERIKVYLWYKDIDQDEVNALTTKATGLTPESCAVIKEFPSAELIRSYRSGKTDAKTQMQGYFERTKSVRDAERKLTEQYSKKHMEISNDKYNQKSEKIRKSLSIDDKNTIFSSEFAPMIIAELTKGEIERASKDTNIEQISLYVESEMLEESSDSALDASNVNEITESSVFGLTGEGVKLAILENYRVFLRSDNPGDCVPVELEKVEQISTNTGVTIYDYGRVAYTDSVPYDPSRTHATRIANISLEVASNIKLYCGKYGYRDVEALVEQGVKLFNISVGTGVSESSDSYTYTDYEKWIDYLISNHGITVVTSAGNNGNTENPRITQPGMAYNIITVGAYAQAHCSDSIIEDEYIGSSSYKNSINGSYGCEKPDVVMPAVFYQSVDEVTSYAAAHLTGIVALMYELKPSLENMPHLVKAITIASCHRKVNQSENYGGPESIDSGITERQGAGTPDACTMACIISQGTYGTGSLGGTDTKINVVQPPYGAKNINFSITWLRDNYVEDDTIEKTTSNDVTLVQASNIDFSIYQEDSKVAFSQLPFSSTEMCYVDVLNSEDFNYQLRLTQNSSPINLKYAYAWSTDNMYAPVTLNEDGIYHIKNSANGRYLVYDTSSSTPKATLRSINTQLSITDTHKWIIEYDNNLCNISNGYGSTKLYLGQNTTQSETTNATQLNSIAHNISIQNNSDGTISFVNPDSNRLLTYSGANLVWGEYNEDPTNPPAKYKWCLDKVNYLFGDVNMDGDLEPGEDDINEEGEEITLPGLDQIYVQNYLSGAVSMNNLQKFLADIDKDGIVSIFDASIINRFAENKFI